MTPELPDVTVQNIALYSGQVLAVVTAAGLAVHGVRRAAPLLILSFWRAVIGSCLALPFIAARATVLPDRSDALAADAPTLLASAAEAIGASSSPLHAADLILPAIAIGIVTRGAWLLVGLLRLRHLTAESTLSVPCAAMADLCETIAPHAELRTHPRITQPATFGVRRPIVLLPPMLDTLPEDVQRAVLCHELLHVRRRDWLWTLAEGAVRTVFWFHPAMRWALNRAQLAREQRVDAAVVVSTGSRRRYAEALVTFADRAMPVPAMQFVGRSDVSVRVRGVLEEGRMSRKHQGVAGVALTAVLAGSAWASGLAMPLVDQQNVQTRTSDQGSVTFSISPPSQVPTYRPRPDYPADAIRSAVGATVTLTLTMNANGDVTDVRNPRWQPWESGNDWKTADDPQSASSSAYRRAFVDSAETAVRQWRFPSANQPSTFDVTLSYRVGQQSETTSTQLELLRESGVAVRRLKVGGAIKPPWKVQDARPVYPPDARTAGVQGVVIAEVVIGADGSIVEARILRSIPLLDQAALDAVRQWRFQPTLMNGQAVEVVMTVTVNFTLK